MLRSAAKTYIAQALSGASDANRLALAQDALFAAIEEWNLRHDWSFLLMDTSGGFTVAACTLAAGTVTTSTANGFAGVNVGQTAVGATIGTVTVTAVTSSTTVTVTGGVNNGPETLTFSADIPLRTGVAIYALPTPMKRPYSVRTLTNPQPLQYREQREIDRMFSDLTSPGTPAFYNIYNPATFAPGTQNGKIQVFPVPGSADTLRARYHRPIAETAADGTDLDLPDRYVYALLELGRYYFLRNLDTENPRTGEAKERAEVLFRRAIWDDTRATGDRDAVLVSQMDHARMRQVDSFDDFLGI